MAKKTAATPSKRNTTDAPVASVAFVSLGCPKNLVDSEKMLGLLAEDGLAVVSYGQGANAEEPAVDGHADESPTAAADRPRADAVVINTCGFLEASKEESLSVIREAIRDKEAGRVKRVVVAGCLVQRHRAKMLDWAPGIDAMIGVFDRDHIVEAVRGAKADRTSLGEASDKPRYWIAGNALQAAKARGMPTTGLTVHGKDGKGIGYFEDDAARLRLTPRHYAYLRISEGCNQNCAFCTIPSIRGKMRSKPIDRIKAEAKELLADGAFELHLIGQDTTSYGDDLGAGMAAGGGLPAMLRAVDEAYDEAGAPRGRSGGWIRLMYAYPSNFSDDMIDAFARLADQGRVLPYIDIPLQHASDRVLTAMRRHVSAAQQRDLMLKLRDRIPGMAIRTTFITGFPGETEADHTALMEFVEEIGFDAMGVFEYSHEEGTVAGTMENDPNLAVPAEIKARRKAELMELQQRIAFAQAEYLAEQFDEKKPTQSGVQFDVLIDSATPTRGLATSGVTGGKSGRLHQGRAYFQAPLIDALTYVHAKRDLSPGELVRCTIVAADGYDLIARPVEELEHRVGLKVIR
ncbi:MAG: 30S ribosomal protein S12 methylthiotransferase RimO [Phycisphaeraceae bacterium]|nr:30S ribosomal protein S12 methylthiotransferase RimO [Phycisphaeraceae bacterium]